MKSLFKKKIKIDCEKKQNLFNFFLFINSFCVFKCHGFWARQVIFEVDHHGFSPISVDFPCLLWSIHFQESRSRKVAGESLGASMRQSDFSVSWSIWLEIKIIFKTSEFAEIQLSFSNSVPLVAIFRKVLIDHQLIEWSSEWEYVCFREFSDAVIVDLIILL
jgi:hypothetical protein